MKEKTMKFDPTVYGRSMSGNFGQMYVGEAVRAPLTRKFKKAPRRRHLKGFGQVTPSSTAPLSYKLPGLGGVIVLSTAVLFGGLTVLATKKLTKKSRAKWVKKLTTPIALGGLAGLGGFFGARVIGDRVASVRI
jgi:hypothetical protein